MWQQCNAQKHVNMGQELQLIIRMRKKKKVISVISMIVDARLTGLSISVNADLLGFPCAKVSSLLRIV